MFSSVNYGLIIRATEYLVENEATEPKFWGNHTPDLDCDVIRTRDGTSDRRTKGKLTHIFQAAIDNLSQTLASEFNLKALRCRQGAASLMYGLGLTLDLDPLASSTFRIKLGEDLEIEVPTEVIRRSAYLRAIIMRGFDELKTGLIDLTENDLTNVSLEAWKLYFSETVLEEGWAKKFFDKPVLVAELFQIATYLSDSHIEEDCIWRFKDGIKTYKYAKAENVKNLREEVVTVLDILYNLGRDDLIKILMMNKLVDTSPNTIPLLEETQALGIDIQHLSLQDHNESWIDRDYDAQLEKIAVFCPNLKSLELTVSADAQFSRLPDAWKTSLVHLTMGHNAKKLPIAALDNMPNLEHLWFRQEGRTINNTWCYPNPYTRDPIECPKLRNMGTKNPDCK